MVDQGMAEQMGRRIYESAGLDPRAPVTGGAAEILLRVLGKGCFMRQPRAVSEGSLAIVRGERKIVLRAGMGPARENFWTGVLLARFILEDEAWFRALSHAERDTFARAVGVWLVAPPDAVRAEVAAVGIDLRAIARVFMVTETCAAMRLPEADAGPPVAVVTPHEVHRRGRFPWLQDDDLRTIAESHRPKALRRAAIHDESGRCALFARAG
jgi:hypothetical protein